MITTLCVIAIHLLDIDVTVPGVPVETERDRAALQRLASRSTRFNYAELLVFDAYCIGHGRLIAVLVGPVLAPGTPTGLSLILGRALLLVVGYVAVFNLITLLVINAVVIAGLL